MSIDSNKDLVSIREVQSLKDQIAALGEKMDNLSLAQAQPATKEVREVPTIQRMSFPPLNPDFLS